MTPKIPNEMVIETGTPIDAIKSLLFTASVSPFYVEPLMNRLCRIYFDGALADVMQRFDLPSDFYVIVALEHQRSVQAATMIKASSTEGAIAITQVWVPTDFENWYDIENRPFDLHGFPKYETFITDEMHMRIVSVTREVVR